MDRSRVSTSDRIRAHIAHNCCRLQNAGAGASIGIYLIAKWKLFRTIRRISDGIWHIIIMWHSSVSTCSVLVLAPQNGLQILNTRSCCAETGCRCLVVRIVMPRKITGKKNFSWKLNLILWSVFCAWKSPWHLLHALLIWQKVRRAVV